MRLEIVGEVSHECGNGNNANRGRCVIPERHVAMPRRVAKVINDARGRMLQKPAYSVIVMLPSCMRRAAPSNSSFPFRFSCDAVKRSEEREKQVCLSGGEGVIGGGERKKQNMEASPQGAATVSDKFCVPERVSGWRRRLSTQIIASIEVLQDIS